LLPYGDRGGHAKNNKNIIPKKREKGQITAKRFKGKKKE
jgi:hypothetical protein